MSVNTSNMFKRSLPALALLTVAACEGSDDIATVAPLSTMGFASATNTQVDEYDYTVSNATRITGEGEDIALTRDDTIELRGTTGVGTIEVVIDGETYTLTRASGNPNFASFEDGDDTVILATLINGQLDAVAVELFSLIDGRLNAGNLVVGLDTNPAVIADREDRAIYSGDMEVTLRNGFNDAFGSGEFQLDVNFASSRIGGTAQIFDDDNPNSEFDFDPVTVTLERADVTGNNFAGNVTVLLGDLGGDLVSGGYEGRFFGPNAETVGGQLFGQIDLDDSDTDTLIEGVFLGGAAE